MDRILRRYRFALAAPALVWASMTALGMAQTIERPLAEVRVPTGIVAGDRWALRPGDAALNVVSLSTHPSGLVCGIEGRRHRLFLVTEFGQWVGFADTPPEEYALTFYRRVHAGSGLTLYALDPDGFTIDLYDLHGRWLQRLDLEVILGPLGGAPLSPRDICVDGAGTIYLLDSEGGGLFRIEAEGTRSRRLDELGQWPLWNPAGIGVDGRGQLHVLTADPPALLEIDPDGLVRRARLLEETAGLPAGPWRSPALAVDRWGNVFFTPGEEGSLWVAPLEEPVRALPGVQLGPLSDLATDSNDRLLGVDADTGGIVVLQLEYAQRESSRVPRSR